MRIDKENKGTHTRVETWFSGKDGITDQWETMTYLLKGPGTTSYPCGENVIESVCHIIHKNKFQLDERPKYEKQILNFEKNIFVSTRYYFLIFTKILSHRLAYWSIWMHQDLKFLCTYRKY